MVIPGSWMNVRIILPPDKAIAEFGGLCHSARGDCLWYNCFRTWALAPATRLSQRNLRDAYPLYPTLRQRDAAACRAADAYLRGVPGPNAGSGRSASASRRAESRSTDGAAIYLRAGTFVPAAGQEPNVPAEPVGGLSTSESGYYIVQFNGPVQEAWKEQVENAGGAIFDYVPDFAFIVRMDDAAHAR